MVAVTIISDRCEESRRQFSELLEEELSAEARRRVEDHLEGCEACRSEFDHFRRTIGALQRLPREEPPADLPARIGRAIDSAAPSKPVARRTRWNRHAVAALLVAGIVVGIIRVVPDLSVPPPRRERVAREEARPLKPDRDIDDARQVKSMGKLKDARMREEKPSEAEGFRNKAGEYRLSQADKQRAARAAPSAAVPESVGAVRENEKVSRPDQDVAALLQSPQSSAAWSGRLLTLALARPDELATAWGGLDAKGRARVLAAWREAPPGRDAREKLEAALAQARTPESRAPLAALRNATPVPQ